MDTLNTFGAHTVFAKFIKEFQIVTHRIFHAKMKGKPKLSWHRLFHFHQHQKTRKGSLSWEVEHLQAYKKKQREVLISLKDLFALHTNKRPWKKRKKMLTHIYIEIEKKTNCSVNLSRENILEDLLIVTLY